MAKKYALITGCSAGGIGAAMARNFREKGYYVFATIRNPAKAGDLGQLSDVELLSLEVTSQESINECAAAVQKRTGGSLDVLVNNAGADFVIPLLDVNIDEAKKLYDLNVFSIVAMAQAFAPMLIKAQGVICNVSSIAATMPLAWSGIYSSSKAAAKQISEILRVEMQPLGVRVVTAMVGAVHTPIHDNAGELELPADSYYQNVRDVINVNRKGENKPGSQDVNVTSRNLVNDVTGGSSGMIWRGGTATVAKLITWLLPMGLLEKAVNGGRGVEQIKLTEK